MQTSQIITTIVITGILILFVVFACIVSSIRTAVYVTRSIEKCNHPIKIKLPQVQIIKLAYLWQFGVILLFLVFYGMIVAKLGTH